MSALNAELINFRLDDHDNKLEHLLERSREFNQAIIAIKENTHAVTENIKQHTETLKKLEDDRKEKHYLKRILTTWPAAIGRLIIVCAVVISVVDWSKVQALIKH